MDSTEFDFSIIIPVLNQKERIEKVLKEIIKQCKQYKKYEIIVVDNGSTDGTIDILNNHNQVKILYEHSKRNSPYSARNKGIQHSKYSTIILLDATCIPSTNWLRNGLHKLNNNNTHVVAGNIVFEVDEKSTFSEIYDSLIHVNVKKMVNGGTAPTGNLFIRKKVIESIGLFPDRIRSSGDVIWTRKVTDHGYSLVYGENVIVFYPPKKIKDLAKKRFRIGVGQTLSKNPIHKISSLLVLCINLLKPNSLRSVKFQIEERGEKWMHKKVLGIWAVSVLIKWSFLSGKIFGAVKHKLNKQ